MLRVDPLSRQEISAGSVEILSFPLGGVMQQDPEDLQRTSQCFGLSLKVCFLTISNGLILNMYSNVPYLSLD